MKIIKIPSDNIINIPNFARAKVILDSEFMLKFIRFGIRDVSVIDLNKTLNEFYVRKTWSFYSEMIKIIYEDKGSVLFLNSENFLCIMNSKHQSQVRILCKNNYAQAVMFVKNESDSWYIFADCNNNAELIEISSCGIINRWKINDSNVLMISIRGFFLNFKTSTGLFSLRIKNFKSTPFELIKYKFDDFEAMDILGCEEDPESQNFLGYKYLSIEGKVLITEHNGSSILNTISIKDTSLMNSKLEFGRYICFSSMRLLYHHLIFIIFSEFKNN